VVVWVGFVGGGGGVWKNRRPRERRVHETGQKKRVWGGVVGGEGSRSESVALPHPRRRKKKGGVRKNPLGVVWGEPGKGDGRKLVCGTCFRRTIGEGGKKVRGRKEIGRGVSMWVSGLFGRVFPMKKKKKKGGEGNLRKLKKKNSFVP